MPEARYFVDIDKTDDFGYTMGSSYNGQIKGSDEAIKCITESLNRCGDNLTCYNPFLLGSLGGETLNEHIVENMPENSGDEQVIEFSIKVKIRIGKF